MSITCHCSKTIQQKSYKRHLLSKFHLTHINNSVVEIKENVKKTNNETFGITCEKMVCDMFDIYFPHSHRTNSYSTSLRNDVKMLLLSNNIIIDSYCGDTNKKVDFILINGKTLSLKSNIKMDKVCPQIIGQTTGKKFNKMFNISCDRKEYIMKHVDEMIPTYLEYLFCCDYLLWINKDGTCRLYDRQTIKSYNLFNKITFTRTLENWNESNTLKVGKDTLGEFQIHTNRDCIKFRFKLSTLIKLNII